MKTSLNTKLVLALSSLIIVPILLVILTGYLMHYNIIQITALQNLDINTIKIIANGKNSNELILVPIIFLGVYVISLFAMILVISKIISDFVLTPLKELNYATEKISDGDFNFKLKYAEDNEFGKLCQEFELMKNNLILTNRKQEIYENSRKKLIASITHDLKTPLTSIIGYVEGLQDEVVTDPDTITNYLDVIHDKSIRLNHLIDDLFTFTQLELEKFSVNATDISMKQVLEEYTDTKLREFESEKINFIIKTPIDDAIISADEFRLGQVLENLINNAKKYTTTYIKLYTEISEEFYCIYIEDDGIGISEEDLPYIFEYFYQCDKARETKREGTGLGLAICKQLVESHKGKIFVYSKLGEKTIFKIRLIR